jgi:hypothetical protein
MNFKPRFIGAFFIWRLSCTKFLNAEAGRRKVFSSHDQNGIGFSPQAFVHEKINNRTYIRVCHNIVF